MMTSTLTRSSPIHKRRSAQKIGVALMADCYWGWA
jgi:hypothetical protein